MDRITRYQRHLANGWWAMGGGMLGRRPNALFLTHPGHICESQIYPYYHFRRSLVRDLGFDFREMPLEEYANLTRPLGWKPQIVFVQPWFTIAGERLDMVLARVRNENPDATVVFLDSYAPLDLRFAEAVDPYIDVYVKKSVFRDRSRYGEATFGDTNLADYFGKRFGLEHSMTHFPIPPGFLDKLVVGPGFVTASYMLPRFLPSEKSILRKITAKRPIDVHARLGGTGDSWYGRMRQHAKQAVGNIRGLNVAAGGMVSHAQYVRELKASKLCFSPFGFGEICWRDYEAAMHGALLIKPDMRHVETHPDIFEAFETYIPVRWDLSDLEEEVRYYLKHDMERTHIARNAYRAVRNYFRGNGFQKHVESLMKFSDPVGRTRQVQAGFGEPRAV